MDENKKIDAIKEKILNRINTALDYMTTEEIYPTDVQRSMVIKNLVSSYDCLERVSYYFINKEEK